VEIVEVAVMLMCFLTADSPACPDGCELDSSELSAKSVQEALYLL